MPLTEIALRLMPIKYYNQESNYRLPKKRKIAEWIQQCAKAEGLQVGDISYIFCSSERHLEINRQYLGHDYNTDVITFDYSDLLNKSISGDIFIDPKTVSSNALIFQSSATEEMLRVMIHGILHLCGYNDSTPDELEQMRKRENFHLSQIYPFA